MAMTLLLAAAKHLVPIDQALRRHDWRPRYEPSPSIMLEGKLALIYGYGAIGKRVARGCIGLGMEAVGIRRKVTVAYEDGAVRVTDPSELPDLLPRTTALMVCLPQTSETTGVIGREELAVLPKESVVVNVGRGELIEEQALYEALAEGRVHSAGMDVWYEYPKDRESRGNTPAGNYPFHELDNLVMSPHRGALGGEAETMRMTELAELLNAAARGETIPNRVDVAIGY
jgi:phosphoglycerate dehydrogenase-like enzyme